MIVKLLLQSYSHPAGPQYRMYYSLHHPLLPPQSHHPHHWHPQGQMMEQDPLYSVLHLFERSIELENYTKR